MTANIDVFLTLSAISEFIEKNRRNADVSQRTKQLMRTVGFIIIRHTRMVSAHNKMAAAEILPAKGRKDGLSRPGIPRIILKGRQQHLAFGIILLCQKFVTFEDNFAVIIALFLQPNQWMDKNPVAMITLEDQELNMLVSAVCHVSRVKPYNSTP